MWELRFASECCSLVYSLPRIHNQGPSILDRRCRSKYFQNRADRDQSTKRLQPFLKFLRGEGGKKEEEKGDVGEDGCGVHRKSSYYFLHSYVLKTSLSSPVSASTAPGTALHVFSERKGLLMMNHSDAWQSPVEGVPDTHFPWSKLHPHPAVFAQDWQS